ncbi:MAG: sigma-54-dependent Fis family transcriptional regulator [Candidatus Rokubacteria bacterium]|nr:sigma-54-dependent Fis family transcriptional regulator [Candidatus Rokubacteria bacterium]
MPVPGILIADDDPVARDLLAEVLAKEGYRVRAAAGGRECLELARSGPVDLALLDLRMPDLDGLEVLRQIQALHPGVPILILTAFATLETAIEAIRAGAYDYLSKPFRMEEIRLVVRRALEQRRLAEENVRFRQALRDRYRFENVVGLSPRMVEVYRLAARAAATDATVLLLGETGTGKELIARAIHQGSARAEGPFIAVDCTALPEALFESELFGHARGAFTGAVTTKRGLLENARGGTVLLDEIGDLAPALQAKLLRALQEREIRRVGAGETIPVDVRVISATNRDLQRRVEAGEFREDLYYRLRVVTIALPPLRARREDIPLLAQHFLEKLARSGTTPVRGIARAALERLAGYDWPGNVRELENVITRAATLSSAAVLMPEDFAFDAAAAAAAGPALPQAAMTLEAVKHWYVSRVLADVGGNKQRAAAILGVDRRTLYRILAKAESNEGDA